jgi:hypothetical protein
VHAANAVSFSTAQPGSCSSLLCNSPPIPANLLLSVSCGCSEMPAEAAWSGLPQPIPQRGVFEAKPLPSRETLFCKLLASYHSMRMGANVRGQLAVNEDKMEMRDPAILPY